MSVLCSLALALAAATPTYAAGPVPGPGPWVPIFKGVDQAVGTNTPGLSGSFPELQVVHCIRVDLTDPDIRLFTTPRASSYVAESRETLDQGIPHFLTQYKLQVVSDANFYDVNPGGADPTSEGLPTEVYGLQICTGAVVSVVNNNEGDARFAALLFTTNNQPRFAFNNRAPGTNLMGIYTAITGYYPVVSNGVNFGVAVSNTVNPSGPYYDTFIHGLQPRTAFGVDKTNRYLLLMTIDGRQGGYSDGAYDAETAAWMLQFGAWNAISMDGGGSTALYMSDSAGNPVAVNHSSYLPAYGRERYIGSHFGVYAKPVPGFFTNVIALPADNAATITWSTIDLSTTQVKYGLTSLNLATPLATNLVANHAVLLPNLTPNTTYYYQTISTIGANQWTSSIFAFVTTNYVTTNLLCDFTSSWKSTTADLDGSNWTAPSYDDSAWVGPDPGLFLAETEDLNLQNQIPEPLTTTLPLDPDSLVPYTTYYFRTHFTSTNQPGSYPLLLQDYLADGAVFYLNGVELYRERMPAGAVFDGTYATAHPCSGYPTCPDIAGLLATNLALGDNVLAVEVHTCEIAAVALFGMSLAITNSFTANPLLSFAASKTNLTLSWPGGGFTLQQAGALKGPWTNTPGPVVSSPFTTPTTSGRLFYRLKK